MNGCIFLRDRMLYTACRTALLLLTSTVYTCNSNADIHDQWPTDNVADNSVMWHTARIKWPNATDDRHNFSHVTTTAVTWPRLIWFEDSRMVLLHSAPDKAPAKSVLWRSACHWRMPEGKQDHVTTLLCQCAEQGAWDQINLMLHRLVGSILSETVINYGGWSLRNH